MGRKRWTTPEQTSWLQKRVPEYLESKDDTTGAFQKKIFSEWKQVWPVDAPTEEEIATAGGSVTKAQAELEGSIRKVRSHHFRQMTMRSDVFSAHLPLVLQRVSHAGIIEDGSSGPRARPTTNG